MVSLLDRRLAVILPLPAIVVMLVLMGYPFVNTLLLSIQQVDLTLTRSVFVGTDNFRKVLFEDERFRNSVFVTVYFSMASVTLELVFGMAMALVLNREFRGLGLIRTLFLLPLVATPTATSVTWMIMMEPSIGVLNYLLEILGLPPSLWIAGPTTVIPSLVMVNVWHGVPFVMLILLAGLRSLPKEPFESALIDGASKVQVFVHITLPLLRPSIVVALLFRTIDTLKVFDAIWIMTRGGPGRASETLHVYSYLTAFEFYDLGYGSAVILAFMGIILAISLVWMKVRQRSWI
ncbi:MAG: sugar ABC transporter permease [Chloroflexi bacterium]|nr:sugar ABC transporter permease [Chloroflexota bacterium]